MPQRVRVSMLLSCLLVLTLLPDVAGAQAAGRDAAAGDPAQDLAHEGPRAHPDDLPPLHAPEPRIVGGEPAPDGAYPWMAHLSMGCGASLVHADWLLTAAHCVASPGFTARIGVHALNDPSQGETRTVTQVIRHPDYYDPVRWANDAALLRLNEPVTTIEPVALATMADDGVAYPDGTTVRTIGWGATSPGGPGSNILRQVDVEVVDDCGSYDPELISPDMICAGVDGGGKDACQGDSGGPLFVPDDDDQHLHIGVVSWGNSCALANYPGVYARTAVVMHVEVEAGSYEADPGTAFQLSGSSDDPFGLEDTYTWDLSDAGIAEPITGQDPTVTIDAGGTYEITLTVTTEDGRTSTDTGQITVSGRAPAISVDPPVLDFDAPLDGTGAADLQVVNLGDDDLVWDVVTGASGSVDCDTPLGGGWLSADPASGATTGGGASTVVVTADASDLEAGDHEAMVCVASNDPTHPLVEVPVALTVTGGPDPAPELVAVAVEPSEASLEVGGEQQLTATAVYDDGSEVDVTAEAGWASDDTHVAVVTDAGRVAGVAEGTAEIAATFDGESGSATLTVTDDDAPDGVFRLFGADRFETAVTISGDSFDVGAAGSVVLARGDDFADALAGTPLAVDRDGPILLTPTDALIDIVADEIDRVLPTGRTVYLLGGTAALDESVEAAVSDMGYATVRLSGPERIATSLAIAENLGDPDELLITTGFNFPDALAAGAAAAQVSGAVILTTPDEPDPAVDAYLAANPDATTYGIGGPAARAYPDATPIFGATREATAALVADRFFTDHTAIGIARQDDFPDALAGGAHIGLLGGPLLLSPTDVRHAAPLGHMCANHTDLTTAYIYGGTAAIGPTVADAVDAAITGASCG